MLSKKRFLQSGLGENILCNKIKEIKKTIRHVWRRLWSCLFEIKKVLSLLLSKLLLKINLYIIWINRSEVPAYQSSKVLDLNIQVWSWSHGMEVYVEENLQGWFGSCGLEACLKHIHIRDVYGSQSSTG